MEKEKMVKKIKDDFFEWYREFYEWDPFSVFVASMGCFLSLILLPFLIGQYFGLWYKY